MRRDVAAAAAAAAALLAIGSARAERDSRIPTEAALLTVLRIAAVEGGAARGDGVRFALDDDRRTARARARFVVEAAPGEHLVTVEGPEPGTQLTVDGVKLELAPPDDPQARACARIEAPPRGIDPSRPARVYALSPVAPAPCARQLATVTVGPSGRARVELEAALTPGFDRLHRRRTFPEVAHMSTRRADFFVYHYALAGPSGPIDLVAPARSEASARWDGPILRAAATEKRKLPLAVTALVGFSVLSDGSVKVAGKLALEALLPWGDQVQLALDGDHSLRLSASLGYQLFARWIAFFPVGAHLETGAVVDLTPRARAGGRIGVGGHFNWGSTQVLLDLFKGDPAGVDWRVIVVSGIGF